MDWYTSNETDFTGLNESDWQGLADGTPSSVSGTFYWLSIPNFEYALLNESQWEVEQETIHTDPPYVASGYVSGVCNHEVVIISN